MNKDIEDIFSNNMENQIKKEIKKKRKQLNLKLITISIISTLIIIILGILTLNFASHKYIENAYTKEEKKLELENVIMNPNEYIGKETCEVTGYFKYLSTYEYGKRIAGKVIYAGSTNYLGGLLKDKMSKERLAISNIPLNDNISERSSDVYGLRKLQFLYPYVNYEQNIYDYQTENNKIPDNTSSSDKENIINDFQYLNEIDNDKTVEMALSFNKEYSYEEVNKMLDSNLITFYWVDNNSEDEKEHAVELKNPAFNVIGIKSTDGAGEFRVDVDSRMENFKTALKQLKEIGDTQYIENIDENNIKIGGAVVIGSPKELKGIQNNPIIKHAILGTVVDKY